MHMWHDNNIQDLHFPETIKVVTTVIHYCYCWMAYGKWRPVIWYRMINITFFFCVKKLLGIIFILKFYAQIGMFTRIFLYLKEIIFERVITMTFRNLCLIFRNLPSPQKFLAMRLHSIFVWFVNFAEIVYSICAKTPLQLNIRVSIFF